MFAPLLLALVLPAAEPNEAEKVFRQMETKVTKMKTVEVAFTVKVDNEKIDAKGTVLVGEGNKLRVDVTDEGSGKKENHQMISDGSKMGMISNNDLKESKDAPAWLNDGLKQTMCRGGVFLYVMAVANKIGTEKEFKVDEHFKLSDFKLGKKEKVGDKETQAVEYTLTIKDKEPLSVPATVWIDTKTQLPVKRTLVVDEKGKKVTITETYSKIDPDAKMDAKQFELPKK
jgi:outer membrane lipoprotein-sorting protein